MAGFRKAKTEQEFIKMAIYGPPGSGKTFSTLLFAEGLAEIEGKRIAYVDTEHGTDFYAQDSADRGCHPKAFDFDALYTRSLMEVIKEVEALSTDKYGVIIIDSVTHFWEAARNAFTGDLTSAETIPFHAWGKIKKPYKRLISFLLATEMHAFILGRQGNEFADDPKTGDVKMVGVKMKAEGETPYEPHILLRMEASKAKDEPSVITAWAEKDRTGVLAGKIIRWPTFENTIAPILPLLIGKQAKMQDEDDAAIKDAEALNAAEDKKQLKSSELATDFIARLMLAKTAEAVEAITKELTPKLKKSFTKENLDAVRKTYKERIAALPSKDSKAVA